MPRGIYKRDAKTKAFPCVFGCGKMFAFEKSSKKCAKCIAAKTKETPTPANPDLKGILERLASLEATVKKQQELITGRKPRGEYKKEARPDVGFGDWDAAVFMQHIIPARDWYMSLDMPHAGGKIDILDTTFTQMVAHVLFFMNGKQRIVEFNATYDVDQHDDPMFVDLRFKDRNRKRSSKHALKLLTDRNLIPETDELEAFLMTNNLPTSGKAIRDWRMGRGYMCTRYQIQNSRDSRSFKVRWELLRTLATYRNREVEYELWKQKNDVHGEDTRCEEIYEEFKGYLDYSGFGNQTDWEDVADLEKLTPLGYGIRVIDTPQMKEALAVHFRSRPTHYAMYLSFGGEFVMHE